MRERIEDILKKALGVKTEVKVTVSEREEFGHYSTSVALRLAKERKQNPIEVAKEIAELVQKKAPKGFLARVEVALPGFINFWITQDTLITELQKILKEKKKYGTSKIGKGKKVQVEYVSANPTGPLTLANGRGGFLGDTLSNVLEWTGHSVEREFYVNDSGNQVLTLGKAILAAQGIILEEESFYKGEYVKEWSEKNKSFVLKNKNSALKIGQRAAKDFLADIKKVLTKDAKIHFDRWTSEEKAIREKGLVKKIEAVFKKKRLSYQSEGATWLKTTEFGDDKDRVLTKSDGELTYFFVDAGHYLETKQRGFDGKILILGPDHYGYVSRTQAVAKIVGLKESNIIITQAIRVMQNGEEVKMSKRKGAFIAFEELLEDVGADVARYIFLSVAPETHIDFDLELAKEHSMRNPVYYVQYALVRGKGIAKNVDAKIKKKKTSAMMLGEYLSTPEDTKLLFLMSRFGEVVQDVAHTQHVHQLTRYAHELARAFHNFYEKERVAGEKDEVAAARLKLVGAYSIVFSNLFKVLGISEPEKM